MVYNVRLDFYIGKLGAYSAGKTGGGNMAGSVSMVNLGITDGDNP